MPEQMLADVLCLGRARRYDTAVALSSRGQLGRLLAGGYLTSAPRAAVRTAARAIPSARVRRLSLRASPDLPDARCVPIWRHLASAALLGDPADRFFALRAEFSRLAGVASRAPVVIAEQTEALEAFEIAGRRGARRVLMMTGASPAARNRMLAEEHLRWPPARPVSLAGRDSPLVDRELVEIQQADVVLSPSSYVTESLGLYECFQHKRVRQVSWPVWGGDRLASVPRTAPRGRPTRILFVGQVGLGKGVMYLVEALERLDRRTYEARLVGAAKLPPVLLDRCRSVATLTGVLSPAEVREQYDWADVFALPSLSEGRARATIEAMAAALPVVVTPNAGAPVEHGASGLLVPPRDPDAIAEAIGALARNADLYRATSQGALAVVSQLTVARYAVELSREALFTG